MALKSHEMSTQIEVIARHGGLIDSDGKPNISRMLALLADKSLKDTVTERRMEKQAAGHDSIPKGLMLQINKRIKENFGISVTDMKDDSEFQEIVAMVRSAVARALKRSNVDWHAKDFEQQDYAAKQEIYDLINRMIAAYKGEKV
jgi:hypothetical protein